MKLRPATPDDLDRLLDLEVRSYPSDEAASRQSLGFRIENAPDCFWLAEDERGLLGFVCGTRSNEATLVESSMGDHHPSGPSLCIHSVVIDPDRRRSGLGTALVKAYLEHTRTLPGLERVLLICKQHLVAFYGSNGFELVGPSEVVHGADPWFEMRRGLPGVPKASAESL